MKVRKVKGKVEVIVVDGQRYISLEFAELAETVLEIQERIRNRLNSKRSMCNDCLSTLDEIQYLLHQMSEPILDIDFINELESKVSSNKLEVNEHDTRNSAK